MTEQLPQTTLTEEEKRDMYQKELERVKSLRAYLTFDTEENEPTVVITDDENDLEEPYEELSDTALGCYLCEALMDQGQTFADLVHSLELKERNSHGPELSDEDKLEIAKNHAMTLKLDKEQRGWVDVSNVGTFAELNDNWYIDAEILYGMRGDDGKLQIALVTLDNKVVIIDTHDTYDGFSVENTQEVDVISQFGIPMPTLVDSDYGKEGDSADELEDILGTIQSDHICKDKNGDFVYLGMYIKTAKCDDEDKYRVLSMERIKNQPKDTPYEDALFEIEARYSGGKDSEGTPEYFTSDKVTVVKVEHEPEVIECEAEVIE